MPLLEKIASGVGLDLSKKTKAPAAHLQDYDSLEIVEFVDKKEQTKDKITLAGSFMPHIPFQFGGTQQLVKDYYAGSTEPTVHVLGPRETDQSIKGTLKTKFLQRGSSDLTDDEARAAALTYQELIDGMRLRGNLVKITMGEWKRYGFIEEVIFQIKRVTEIDYEIKFMIVGFNPPSNYKITNEGNNGLVRPNKDLAAKIAGVQAAAALYPASMPQTIADLINNAISDVAGVVKVATDFVDEVVGDVDKLASSINRAIGLLKYARSYVSSTRRKLGTISLDVNGGLAAIGIDVASRRSNFLINTGFVNDTMLGLGSLQAQLADLQNRFKSIGQTVAKARYLVVQGDTLQKISIKFFNSANYWFHIYDHNNLQSTKLVPGTVLEIPNV